MSWNDEIHFESMDVKITIKNNNKESNKNILNRERSINFMKRQSFYLKQIIN